MPYLLNFAYVLLLIAVSPWLLWSAIRKGKYRSGWSQKFLGRAPRCRREQPCIWFHAVSVGEVNLLQPLIAAIEAARPDCRCVISTTTKTGFDLARRKYSPRAVFYCPLDFSWAVRNALRRVQPDLLVLAELELWPNLIREARQSGAEVMVVNGRLSERSFRGYRKIGRLVRSVLRQIRVVAAQNQEYADRFRELGARNVVVTGSVKFDGAETDRANPTTRRFAQLAGIGSNETVLLAGSTQAPEERLALETYLQLRERHPQLRLLITPRHPERFAEVASLLEDSGVAWQRRSCLDEEGLNEETRVVLIDAVGELQAWWGVADIAFVGGSMGKRGGQNMIEPAAYGAAVCFGPRTSNFRDVVAMLLDRRAAQVVEDGKQLQDFVLRCLEEPDFARELGERAQRLVLRQQGAVDRTLEEVLPLLPSLGGPLVQKDDRAA